MDGIRLQNIRSFRDTKDLTIHPITLLIGKNSSGKSSVARAVPLISQSVMTRSNSPILWYGEFVDFGSVAEVKNNSSKDEYVEIDFKIKARQTDGFLGYYSPFSQQIENVWVGLRLKEVEERTSLDSFSLRFDEDFLEVQLDRRGGATSVSLNGEEFVHLFSSEQVRFLGTEVVPQIRLIGGASRRSNAFYEPYRTPIGAVLVQIQGILRRNLHGSTSTERILEISRKLRFSSGDNFISDLKSKNSSMATLNRWADNILSSPTKIREIRQLSLLANLKDILTLLQRSVVRASDSVTYIGPVRATGERYYRIQELAVDRIDPKGANLAMYLHSLNRVQLDAFSDWLAEAIGFRLRIQRSAGHIQIQLREEGGVDFFNLADMGYGFSQVLPILAQIWSRGANEVNRLRVQDATMVLEQPELHLHPAYQARLADVFVAAIQQSRKLNSSGNHAKFIIETHSEAMINRFGELVYEKKLSKNQVGLYLFDRPEGSSESKISKAEFDEGGRLQNWPVGFLSY